MHGDQTAFREALFVMRGDLQEEARLILLMGGVSLVKIKETLKSAKRLKEPPATNLKKCPGRRVRRPHRATRKGKGRETCS